MTAGRIMEELTTASRRPVLARDGSLDDAIAGAMMLADLAPFDTVFTCTKQLSGGSNDSPGRTH
jgi:hypothetical protein